jgi:hypothetical protein
LDTESKDVNVPEEESDDGKEPEVEEESDEEEAPVAPTSKL